MSDLKKEIMENGMSITQIKGTNAGMSVASRPSDAKLQKQSIGRFVVSIAHTGGAITTNVLK